MAQPWIIFTFFLYTLFFHNYKHGAKFLLHDIYHTDSSLFGQKKLHWSERVEVNWRHLNAASVVFRVYIDPLTKRPKLNIINCSRVKNTSFQCNSMGFGCSSDSINTLVIRSFAKDYSALRPLTLLYCNCTKGWSHSHLPLCFTVYTRLAVHKFDR